MRNTLNRVIGFSIDYMDGFQNSQGPTLVEGKILLGRFSKIINSTFSGYGQIDDFSCVNRSSIGLGFGLGTSSYVADSHVGNFSLIGSRVSIGGFEHPLDWLSTGAFQWGQTVEHWDISNASKLALKKNKKPESANTEIGSDVWIGNNVVVKAGVKIGHGSIIGAGSVVTKDVADFSIMAGNPARLLRMRFPQSVIEDLLRIEWWKIPLELLSLIDFTDVRQAIKDCMRIKRDNKIQT